MKKHFRNALDSIEKIIDEMDAADAVLAFAVLGLAVFSLSGLLAAGQAEQTVADYFRRSPVPVVAAATSAPLPQVQLTLLLLDSCKDCFDPSTVKPALDEMGLNVTSTGKVEYNSSEGNALASKYGVLKLPTFLLFGQTKDSAAFAQAAGQIGRYASDGTFVLEAVPPVYYDVSNKSFVGRVEITELSDSSCAECQQMSQVLDALNSSGMKISAFRKVEANSSEGQLMAKLYNITRAPSLLFSKDLDAYPQAAQAIRKDAYDANGLVVFSPAFPVYEELPSFEKRGLFNLTFVVDSSCSECYNASVHETILARLGAKARNTVYLEYNGTAGAALVKAYDITTLPTFVLAGDAAAYEAILQVWPGVGTVESGGAYVFRNQSVFQPPQPYLDLETMTMVNSPAESPANNITS